MKKYFIILIILFPFVLLYSKNCPRFNSRIIFKLGQYEVKQKQIFSNAKCKKLNRYSLIDTKRGQVIDLPGHVYSMQNFNNILEIDVKSFTGITILFYKKSKKLILVGNIHSYYYPPSIYYNFEKGIIITSTREKIEINNCIIVKQKTYFYNGSKFEFVNSSIIEKKCIKDK